MIDFHPNRWSAEHALAVLPLSQVLEIAQAIAREGYDVDVSEYDASDFAACAADSIATTPAPADDEVITLRPVARRW